MDLNQYQYEAMKTRLPTANANYALYNLSGETGELLSLVAKFIRDGKLDMDLVKKELGDILWCLAAVAGDYGFTLDDVATANLQKLSKRASRGTLSGTGDNR